jgi:hypothetical protein
MGKTVPIKDEKEFIQLDTQMDELKLLHKKAKLKLLKYYEKGYSFSLIEPSDTSAGVFAPPWKKLCLELIAKFMTVPQQKQWMKGIIKRFPKTERAPTFNIIGKKARSNFDE